MVLESDVVRPLIGERLQRKLDEEQDSCPRCMTMLRRDDESADAFDARAMSHISGARWMYFSYSDHLTFIHRRRAIILHCDDHFAIQCDVNDIVMDPRLRKAPDAWA